MDYNCQVWSELRDTPPHAAGDYSYFNPFNQPDDFHNCTGGSREQLVVCFAKQTVPISMRTLSILHTDVGIASQSNV